MKTLKNNHFQQPTTYDYITLVLMITNNLFCYIILKNMVNIYIIV